MGWYIAKANSTDTWAVNEVDEVERVPCKT